MAIMKIVGEDNIDLEKMEEFWFFGMKSFHETFCLSPPIPHSIRTLNPTCILL
jgi:hypothetical protein